MSEAETKVETPAADLVEEAVCLNCNQRIGQSISPHWFHLRNGLMSCGFYAEPMLTPKPSTEAGESS